MYIDLLTNYVDTLTLIHVGLCFNKETMLTLVVTRIGLITNHVDTFGTVPVGV